MKSTDLRFDVRHLGRMEYRAALELQEACVEQRRLNEIGDTLLLVEHEPVYTIGRTRDQSSLAGESTLPHPVVETNRGGQATFHGPGQLVGYPILDLRSYGQDLHTYLRCLEHTLIAACQAFGITASRRDSLTGVWVAERKIASIGVGVRRWISMHGFAINVEDRLEGFESIIPCGIQDVRMTSVTAECGREVSVTEFSNALAPVFGEQLASLAAP